MKMMPPVLSRQTSSNERPPPGRAGRDSAALRLRYLLPPAGVLAKPLIHSRRA